MALRVEHVGQYGAHAEAKRAGFEKGDVIVAFDGMEEDLTESEVLAHAAQHTTPDQQVAVTALRGGKPVKLSLKMQQ